VRDEGDEEWEQGVIESFDEETGLPMVMKVMKKKQKQKKRLF
jgi:hypothetical protein